MATFGTFTAGQILTAAELNSAGTWNDYTPTFTQSATITKTVNWARYTQLNKWVQVSVKLTATSGGTFPNVIKIGLPVNASTNNYVMGTAIYVDDSDNPDTYHTIFCVYDSASTVAFRKTDEYSVLATLWGIGYPQIASGDVMYMNIAYEAE